MLRPMILAAIASLGVAALSGSAAAQIDVEVYAGSLRVHDSYPRYYGYGPPIYGYTRRYYEPGVEVDVGYPRWKGGCGTYRYWDGRRCVDARYR